MNNKQNFDWWTKNSNGHYGKLEVFDARLYRRIGKQKSGRILDGVEWLQRPEE